MKDSRTGRVLARVVSLWILSMLVVTAVAAQPNPGDLLVSDYGVVSDINVLDRGTGQVSTLINFSWISPIDDVIMAADNIEMRASLGGSITSHPFWKVTPLGAVSRVVAVPGVAGFFVAGYDLDQNGGYAIASPAGGLYRAVGMGLTTLYTSAGSFAWHKVATDEDTGDYALLNSNGTALTIDRLSGQATTLVTGIAQATDIAFDDQSGEFWISSNSFGGGGITRYDRQGNVVATFTTTATNAMAIDHVTGDVFGVGTSGVTQYDRTGAAVQTWTGVGSFPTGITIYGHRNVAPGSDGVPTTAGSTYVFSVSFPRSPGAAYCCALSLRGQRPGIIFPGGSSLNIVPDDLFVLTACKNLPGLTTGFVGALNAQGAGAGSFVIPAGVPAGVRITVAAAAVNPQIPGGFDVGETMNVIVD